jgi:hypothetical protein
MNEESNQNHCIVCFYDYLHTQNTCSIRIGYNFMITKTLIMKSSSSFVSLRRSIKFLFVQLLFLATLSVAFLSTAVLPISARSQQLPPVFPELPIQSSVKVHTFISSWSKIVELDVRSSPFHLKDTDDVSALERSVTYEEGKESSSYTLKDGLVSPRAWLEYCEASHTTRTRQHESQQQQRQENCSRPNLEEEQRTDGAYTVLRCDFLLDERSWRIWGKDYHLNRLRESYRPLLQYQVGLDRETQEIDKDEPNWKYENLALDSSLEVMNLLLEEAKTTILRKSDNMNENHSAENGGKSIIIVMLTLLWDPDHNDFQISDDNGETAIRVRGHAFSTMKASQLQNDYDSNHYSNGDLVMDGQNPNIPLQAVVGYLPPAAIERITKHDDYNPNQSGTTLLPNRYQHFPRAKLSSWCRRRRLLEDIFITKDIGDVILTKHCDDEDIKKNQEPSLSSSVSAGSVSTTTAKSSVELLEGLTSNLFVVYPGNILRTAPSTHVLGGYARHLIIDCAEKCGYKVEFGSISLADSSLWEEVFLTSSIRLIMPVNRIFFPNPTSSVNEDDEPFKLEILWELRVPSDGKQKNRCRSPEAASNVLYRELVKHATLYGNE